MINWHVALVSVFPPLYRLNFVDWTLLLVCVNSQPSTLELEKVKLLDVFSLFFLLTFFLLKTVTEFISLFVDLLSNTV